MAVDKSRGEKESLSSLSRTIVVENRSLKPISACRFAALDISHSRRGSSAQRFGTATATIPGEVLRPEWMSLRGVPVALTELRGQNLVRGTIKERVGSPRQSVARRRTNAIVV